MKKTASVKKLKELEEDFRLSVGTHGELTALHPLACQFYSATFLDRAGNADDSQAGRRFKTLARDALFAQTGKRTDDWGRWLDQLVKAGDAEKRRPVEMWGPEFVSPRALREMEVTGQSTEGFVFEQEQQQYARPAVGVYCINNVFQASADYCHVLRSQADTSEPKKRGGRPEGHPMGGAKLQTDEGTTQPIAGRLRRKMRPAVI